MKCVFPLFWVEMSRYQWVLLARRGPERLASTIDDIDVRCLSDMLINYFWKKQGEGQPQQNPYLGAMHTMKTLK